MPFLKLQCVEPGKITSRPDQILNLPLFENFAGLEDDYLVGILNCADPVGNNDDGPSRREGFQSILYQVLGDEIERIRCFVRGSGFLDRGLMREQGRCVGVVPRRGAARVRRDWFRSLRAAPQ